ncbi:MAG: LysR family transcriptional regulator [Henriciella sp.]
MSISLLKLKLFVSVYQEGSMSGAAERVNATQSGVSMHIRQIEKRYGVELFDRKSSGVVPTEAGKVFYSYASKVLHSAIDAEQILTELSGTISGHVRLGLMPTFTRTILAPVIVRLKEEAPHIRLSVTEAYSGILSTQVVDGRLDLAIVPADSSGLNLDIKTMGRDTECLVCAADRNLVKENGAVLSRLPPLNYVLPSAENARRDGIDKYLSINNIKVGEILELDAMFATLELVAESDQVAILPGILCGPDLDGKVRQVSPLANPPLHTEYVRVTPKSQSLSGAAQLVSDMLQDELKKALKITPVSAR